MESKIMTMNRKNKSSFEYEMPQYIPIAGIDVIEITPRVSYETLKCDEDENSSDDDFDQLLDAENRDTSSSDDDDSMETLSSDGDGDDDVNSKPISMMSEWELSEKIAEIYLYKMRQVANTSGRLFVSAAKVRDIFSIIK